LQDYRYLFHSAQHLYEKTEGPGSGSIPLNNGSGSGRSKTCGSSGSPKLVLRYLLVLLDHNFFGSNSPFLYFFLCKYMFCCRAKSYLELEMYEEACKDAEMLVRQDGIKISDDEPTLNFQTGSCSNI
jgi:hypothetical protein